MKSVAEPGEITQLLAATRAGDPAAWDELVKLVYGDLQQIARKLLRGAGRDRTLNTGALIHEYYLRLQEREAAAPQDKNHFLSLAARVMRQVICDYARERLAQKRGGGAVAVELDEAHAQENHHIEQFVELDAALSELAQHNERQARVVECRFFGGLTDAETADALGISVRSVARDWDAARAWLSRDLAG
ncbi:MAG TPA: ECF-type sigma factor [Rudaea sp.]|nr:ECF-type sigma factor [Rudaea sp.]